MINYDIFLYMKIHQTQDAFIKKALLKHCNRYDYSKVKYIDSKTKVKIVCPIHGEFEQAPGRHLHDRACPGCGRKITEDSRRKNLKYFICKSRKKHGNKYDYSKVKYINNSTEVRIICPVHGEFEQVPENHYVSGCRKCAGNIQKTTEEFILDASKVHGDKYDYSDAEYVGAHKKIKIVCREHGAFEQTPDSHTNSASGCPHCGSGGVYSEYYFNKHPERKDSAGVLYMIRMKSESEDFYKIGISIKSAHIRFRPLSKNAGYSVEVIKEVKMSIYDAWKKEQMILSNNKGISYVPKRYFPGHLECLATEFDPVEASIMAGVI